MSAYFITGTGTGVGKTVVATALALALARRGLPTLYLKPVQTGCAREGDGWQAPDLRWAGERFARMERRAPIEGTVLRGYRTPCSPHLAARLEKAPLPYAALVRATRDLARQAPAAVIEGAGGVLTPLDDRRTWIDFLRAAALPVVLVASTGLGTLNHTLLSLAALRAARIRVAGLVLVQATPGPWGVVERDNCAHLPARTGVRLLGVLRHHPDLEDPAAAAPRLSRWGQGLLRKLGARSLSRRSRPARDSGPPPPGG